VDLAIMPSTGSPQQDNVCLH